MFISLDHRMRWFNRDFQDCSCLAKVCAPESSTNWILIEEIFSSKETITAAAALSALCLPGMFSLKSKIWF